MRLKSLAKTAWKQAWDTVGFWQQDDGGLMAAAVAYYGVLSLFPLLMILTSGLGFVLELSPSAQNAQQQVLQAVSQNASPAVAERLAEVFAQVRRQAPVSGPLGLGFLLLAAIGLFINFEKAFNRIWNVEAPEYRGLLRAVRSALWLRGRAFVMLVGLGSLVILVSIVGVVASSVRPLVDMLPGGDWTWSAVQILVTLSLNFGLFTVMYRLLPRVPVRWSEAACGGVVAALLWEAVRQVLSVILAHSRYSAYGIIGSLILVMLWIYTAAAIVFLGAEYVQVIRRSKLKG